jgi:hypothetical protein
MNADDIPDAVKRYQAMGPTSERLALLEEIKAAWPKRPRPLRRTTLDMMGKRFEAYKPPERAKIV